MGAKLDPMWITGFVCYKKNKNRNSLSFMQKVACSYSFELIT